MLLSRAAYKSMRINHKTISFSTIQNPPECAPQPPAEPIKPFNNLENLKCRQLIHVSGNDASNLLQGLITNDIYDIPRNKLGCLYAMFLNPKGRVLCDSLIYSMGEENSYIIETDAEVVNNLYAHIKRYKLRKEVGISRMDSYNVYALYDPRDAVFKTDKGPVPSLLTCYKDPLSCAGNGTTLKDLFIFCDPRAATLGYRILAKKIEVIHEELLVDKVNPPSYGMNFRWLRYNLGIGEGIVDIPPEKALPLEHNCDFMSGLNIHKGCYIGQEVTARTFHTGTIRKRLMPLYLKKELSQTPDIVDIHGNRQMYLGKLRGVQFDAGLALLRIHLVLNLEMNIGDTLAVTKFPHWWPAVKIAKLQAEINKTKL